MPTRTLQLDDRLERYVQSVSVREPLVFARCREETATLPNSCMQVTPEQGQFLAFLVALIGARNAIELGTFTGYSAMWIASALPAKGHLVACDISEQWTSMARRYWEAADLHKKIELRLGPALDTLDALLDREEAGTYDFAFIDADKQNYDAYYERALQLLRPGGLVAIDNVLWSGKVVDEKARDPDTEAIRSLNQKIYRDERVEMTMIPVGDGLTLARKRG